VQVTQNAFQYLLDLGPSIFVGLILFVLGLIVRVKVTRALSAALMFAVAFAGVSLVIGYMVDGIAPAGQALIQRTGIKLNALDFGWPAAAAIAWAWQYAALMLPLQIAINLIMVAFGFTRCLNLDIWNVWGKIFMAQIIALMTGNVIAAWVLAAAWIVLELKSADLTEKQVQHLTGISGVSCPHLILLDIIVLTPVAMLLDRIPLFDRLKTDPQSLRERIGVFGENHTVGFILGLLIGIIGGFDLKSALATAVVGAAGLSIMPIVAAMFVGALGPIQEAVGEFMKARFPGRLFSIGLDCSFMAGLPSLWTAAILLIPVLLLFAITLPGNRVLPFGSILLIESTIGSVVLARNDLVKTWIYAVLISITRIYTATFFAATITTLSSVTRLTKAPTGFSNYTWMGMSYMNWVMLKIADIFSGRGVDIGFGIAVMAVMGGLICLWWREMSKREALPAI